MSEEHRALEVFRTPERVLADFFAYQPRYWRRARVLDPSAGDGRFIRHLVEHYGNTKRHGLIDIRPSELRRWNKTAGLADTDKCIKDFLDFYTRQRYDAVVTNPPFSGAYEFVDHGLQFVKPGGLVCILQKLQWLGTQERSLRHKRSPLFRTLVIPYRIVWEIDGRPDNRADNVEYAWFCFKRGYEGLSTTDWLV